MSFDSFLSWGFTALLSGSLIYGVKILQDIKNSVDELNERMATIIEKTAWHEREMEKMSNRILSLESKMFTNISRNAGGNQ